ncbi:hypothetical protein [Embleya sp. NPDC005575]|uniref:hypothetical protein n=1 Tax=Embleya sp. NPDC005575 TaxID=3156892 RepID=UPI0033A8A370
MTTNATTTATPTALRARLDALEARIQDHRDAVNSDHHRRDTTAWNLRYELIQAIPEFRALLEEIENGPDTSARHLRVA